MNRNYLLYLNKILLFFLVLFIFLFPIVFFAFVPYRVYDGLRLFIYTIPYFTIIPGLTIYYLVTNLNSLINKILSGSIVCLFAYYLAIFISFTPYQYTYLNLFTGNFSNAHKKFENDYWAISIRELIKKIPRETNLISNNTKNKIIFCGAPDSLVKKELKKFKNLKFEQQSIYAKDFDYVIMTNRVLEDREDNILANVTTCFEKFKGEDLITVERNGLMLSTLRKKL